MLERVETAPLILREFPELGSPTGLRGIRKWRVVKAPFVLLYSVAPRHIAIRRVRHAASDWPGSEG